MADATKWPGHASHADSLIFGPAPFQVLLVGAKHSGKSEVIKYTCRAYAGTFACVTVFCPSALSGFYNFLPEKYVLDDYDPEVMRGIIARQEAYKASRKTVHQLVIFDDCIGSEAMAWEKRTSELSRMWISQRHWNISIIVVAQSLKRIPRVLRDNVDFACIFRVMREAYDGLFETFAPPNMTKQEFMAYVAENTRDYRVILFQARVVNPEDHLRVFKLPPSELARKFSLLY